MKVLRWLNYILILAFLSSCSAGGSGGTGGNPISNLFASPTPVILPTAHAIITPAPDAQAAVTRYLDAMLQDDFAGMYDMLNKVSREAITFENFSNYYNDALNNMSASSIEYAINSSMLGPRKAEVALMLFIILPWWVTSNAIF